MSELRKAAIIWYDFKYDSRALIVTTEIDGQGNSKESSIVDFLSEKCREVCEVSIDVAVTEEFITKCAKKFDYIVALNVIECADSPLELLKALKNVLKNDGHMLLGVDNRLGLKNFCGDRDSYTGRSFDGIENYRGISQADRKYIKGRSYSKAELKLMLEASGMAENKFYSVLPNIAEAQLIYSEGYSPKEELGVRYFPSYEYKDSIFLDEKLLYNDVIANGLFHTLANSFLIEYSPEKEFNGVLHATVSLDRGTKNATATIIKEFGIKESGIKECCIKESEIKECGIEGCDREKCVEKRSLYPEGVERLHGISENEQYLKKHSVSMVESEETEDGLIMPYMDCRIALNYLRNLAATDKSKFVEKMDEFKDIILNSSAHVKEDENDGMGVVLERGYVDLVPLNCFVTDGERFVFYDQEFYEDNYPANVILYRLVSLVYMNFSDIQMEDIIPSKFFMDRYGLSENRNLWGKKTNEFLKKIRNGAESYMHIAENQCDVRTLSTNRQRINYTSADYQRIFVDILKNTDNKKLVLFGSGKFTQRFLVQFKGCCEIYAIVDNNADKWGTTIEGIEIKSPDILKDIAPEERHIIICIKNFVGTVLQLKSMGIEDYHVYDPGVVYPRKKHCVTAEKNVAGGTTCVGKTEAAKTDSSAAAMGATEIEGTGSIAVSAKKPYHTGYIAGVFDLFHIGHLNMFKRAKEQCDYLIVGVVSDAGVRINKGTEPFVPFEERIEMVRSCRYVDEAVEIPFNYGSTKDAYEMYHFDCQFSGSDYVNDPNWLAEKEFLEKNGAEMVFFPYTESTSSTKLKKMIDKKLL